MERAEFEILRTLCECSGIMTQRIIAEETNFSLGKVNRVVNTLRKKGLLADGYQVTSDGIQVMEPYKVKNAVILAAGMSTRFAPISYEIPKGLMIVKGEVMIERQIKQLLHAGIQEIVVVVGCMLEKFFYLRQKYHVKLVVNNEYLTKNTHSSLFVARDYLTNTYICCSDIYYPQNMFHAYEYRPYYCAVYLPGSSFSERGLIFNRDGLIYHTNRPSHDQWIMQGHAYFDETFSQKFRPVLEQCFGKPGVENMYWEGIWAEHTQEIPLWIKCCDPGRILEFDRLEDMMEFDPDCLRSNPIKLFENICHTLHCSVEAITDISPIEQGINNHSFRFQCNGIFYVYRHPGVAAEWEIDREKEAEALHVAQTLGIDKTLVYMDKKEGWKISEFVETTEAFNFSDPRHSQMLADALKTLHDSHISIGRRFDYAERADTLIEFEKLADPLSYRKMKKERDAIQPIVQFLDQNPWQISLCHNDLYEPNLLVRGQELFVIDWEYGSDSDIGYDICKLFASTDAPFKELGKWVHPYFRRDITADEETHLIACAAVVYYYWYIWGIHTKRINESVTGFLIKWYDRMVRYRMEANRRLNGT